MKNVKNALGFSLSLLMLVSGCENKTSFSPNGIADAISSDGDRSPATDQVGNSENNASPEPDQPGAVIEQILVVPADLPELAGVQPVIVPPVIVPPVAEIVSAPPVIEVVAADPEDAISIINELEQSGLPADSPIEITLPSDELIAEAEQVIHEDESAAEEVVLAPEVIEGLDCVRTQNIILEFKKYKKKKSVHAANIFLDHVENERRRPQSLHAKFTQACVSGGSWVCQASNEDIGLQVIKVEKNRKYERKNCKLSEARSIIKQNFITHKLRQSVKNKLACDLQSVIASHVAAASGSIPQILAALPDTLSCGRRTYVIDNASEGNCVKVMKLNKPQQHKIKLASHIHALNLQNRDESHKSIQSCVASVKVK